MSVVFNHPKFDEWFEHIKTACNRYHINLSGYQVKADGEITGSIKWNHLNCRLYMELLLNGSRWTEGWMVDIKDPWRNCGSKTISCLSLGHYYTSPEIKKEILQGIESFLWHKTNCSIIIGSDQPHGGTAHQVREYGEGYVFSEPVWNPNYVGQPNHTICIFHKNLDANYGATLPNYWG